MPTDNVIIPVNTVSNSQQGSTRNKTRIGNFKFDSNLIDDSTSFKFFFNGASFSFQNAVIQLSTGTSTGLAAITPTFLVRTIPNSITQSVFNIAFEEKDDFTHFSRFGLQTTSEFIGLGYFFTGDLCILKQVQGKVQILTLTITTASSTSHNATLTLNSIAYSIPLTNAAGNTAFTAFQIATFINTATGLWFADTNGSVLTISNVTASVMPGTFSFTSSSAVGSLVNTQAGTNFDNYVIPKAQWNGYDQFTNSYRFDRTKLNNYMIEYVNSQYIKFFVFDPLILDYVLLHTMKDTDFNANNHFQVQNFTPAVTISNIFPGINHTLKFDGFTAYGLGEEALTVSSKHRAFKRDTVAVVAGVETVIFSLRNKGILNNCTPLIHAVLQNLSVSSDGSGNNPVIYRLYVIEQSIGTLSAGTTADFPIWTDFGTANYPSVISTDINSKTVTGARLLFQKIVNKQEGQTTDLSNKDFFLSAGKVIVFTALSTGGGATIFGGIEWNEL